MDWLPHITHPTIVEDPSALAAFPIFMLWIFIFWMIVLAGAAVTAALANPTRE